MRIVLFFGHKREETGLLRVPGGCDDLRRDIDPLARGICESAINITDI